MRVLLMLLAALLHATSTVNALTCWGVISLKAKEPSKDEVGGDIGRLMECPAGIKHCVKTTCNYGTGDTMTIKGCLATEDGECELPDKVKGVDNENKKNCGISCCTGNLCNGTLGLRSFGTVAAIIAFVAAFFVRWN